MLIIEGIPTAEIVLIPQTVVWRECPGCLQTYTQSSVVEAKRPDETCPTCSRFKVREFVPLDDNKEKVAVLGAHE